MAFFFSVEAEFIFEILEVKIYQKVVAVTFGYEVMIKLNSGWRSILDLTKECSNERWLRLPYPWSPHPNGFSMLQVYICTKYFVC